MAADSQMKNALSGMTARNKIIAVALVVIVLVILWQVIGLFGNGKSTVKMTPPVTTTKNTMSSSQPGAPASSAPDEVQVKQAPVPPSMQSINQERESEQQYMTKLNELESLKIQREIAEMNQAIAAAKLATVTAEKGISDLLTKPVPMPVSQGEYASRLTNPVRAGEAVVVQQNMDVQYAVISVSMQLHKWSAVLGYQGKLYNVSVGDVLPVDGSVVEKIFKDGVVLNKDGKKRKVNIVSAI